MVTAIAHLRHVRRLVAHDEPQHCQRILHALRLTWVVILHPLEHVLVEVAHAVDALLEGLHAPRLILVRAEAVLPLCALVLLLGLRDAAALACATPKG